MSRLLTGLLVVALATIAPAQALAQAATGTIRGKITNATNAASLENVVLTIVETKQQVTSNAYGEYVLRNVPAGEVTLRAAYVGEPDQLAKLTVAAGAELTQDFLFRESADTKRNDDGTIVLNPFVVESERYRNAQAIATAEERNAINIKNVVSIDQFGYIPSGNVGEFVKFMPGIQLDYGASNGNNQGYSENSASGVSVRGFGPEDTAILIDGLPVSSTLPGNLTRQVGLDQMAINNASRVELIKVATPDMPANSIGGQINLVTRNAFEYPKPTYSARLFFNVNSLHPDLFEKTKGPTNKDSFKSTPGLELNASYPITRNLGFSFTGMAQQEFSQSYRAQPLWNNNQAANYQTGAFTNAAGQASSISNPVLTRYQITDSPALTDRNSANFKVDWKPTPNQTLRANVQYSTYKTNEAQRRLDFRPTIANGIVWDGTQTVGAAANSTTAMTVTTRDRLGDTLSAQMQYSIDIFGFAISAAGSISKSVSDFEDEDQGHFSEVALNLNPGRVALYGLEQGIPSRAETFARSTQAPLDYTQLSNWVFDGTTAKSGESHNERTITLYKLDVERSLDFLPAINGHNISVKAGFRRDEDDNMKSGRGTGYRQILRPGASYTVADILDTNYIGQSPGLGLAAQQWASTYKLYEINQARNIFYVPDVDESTNTRVENYNSWVGQQKDLKETTDAYYGMITGRFLDNRLTVLGGMRQESKSRVGRSPFTDNKWYMVKNKDGSIYTDAANPNGVRMDQTTSPLFAATPAGTALRSALTTAGISYPTVAYGSPTSGTRDLAARMLQYQALRPVHQEVDGDPSYSFNTAYKLTKKIDLKAAWSRSFKLQNLEAGASGGVISGTSNFTITEYTDSETAGQSGARGQITVANPALKPETSDNWDFEASYHTDIGGKFSVSFYTKEVTNQVMNYTTYSGTAEFNTVMAAIALDPNEYEDWKVVTSTNSSTIQKTSGWEFEVRHDLSYFGSWGRRISGFASWAMTDFPAPSAPVPYTITNPDGTTSTLTPTVSTVTLRANRFGNAGIQYSGDRLSVQVRGTYRNDNEVQSERLTVNGQIFRKIEPEETRIDLNVNYVLTKNYSLFLSGRDIFNGERDRIWRHEGGLLPDYANLSDRKKFGVSWTFGVSGSW